MGQKAQSFMALQNSAIVSMPVEGCFTETEVAAHNISILSPLATA